MSTLASGTGVGTGVYTCGGLTAITSALAPDTWIGTWVDTLVVGVWSLSTALVVTLAAFVSTLASGTCIGTGVDTCDGLTALASTLATDTWVGTLVVWSLSTALVVTLAPGFVYTIASGTCVCAGICVNNCVWHLRRHLGLHLWWTGTCDT